MTERRDAEKPRYRDAEFHRERPELRAINPVLHHFCDFTGFVPASKGPGFEQLFVHRWSFLAPIRDFSTKHWIFIGFYWNPWNLLVFFVDFRDPIFDEKVTKLGQSEKSIFSPTDGATESNWTDQTLYEIRLNSISTVITLFLH